DSNPKISYEIKDGSNTVVDSGVDVVSGTTASIPSTDGVYTISYTASDKHGNTSVVQTETFTVDKTAPVLTTTDTTKDVKIGTSGTIDYKTLFGLSASDAMDSSVTASKVSVNSSAVNVNKTGSYTVTFSVSDAAGNTQTKDVTIRIVALSVSGIVFEDKDYSSTNNAGDGTISGVTIQLINADDDSVITSTTTQADGTYTMNMPNGSESVTNYAIKVIKPSGYIFADANKVGNTDDSVVNVTSGKSANMTLSGSDYTNVNAGLGADMNASLATTNTRVYVGDNVVIGTSVTNGTKKSDSISNAKASYVYDSGTKAYTVTGVDAGTSVLSVVFEDGYARNTVTRTLDVTVLALPTIDGVDYKTQIDKKVTIETTYTPVDGILSYVSSNSSIVSVDATGEASAKSRGTSIVNAKVTTNDTQAKEATKKILVSVGLENDPVVGTKDAIDAVDFYMSYEQAKNRTKEKMIGYANAEAWSIEEATLNDDVAITDVDDSAIDMSKLETKSSVSAKATKTFPVTFTSANGTKVTVDATIADVNTVLNTKDGEAIEAYDFKIKDSDVKGLDKSKVISLAKGKAWNLSDKSKVAITKVNYSKIQAKKGVYPVTLATKKGTSIKVYAKVLETKTPITGTNELTIAVSIMGIVSLLGLAKFKLREE
ncbi:hypothetical protein OKW22_001413, partial [Bacilli bacterium PM5-3]|nr:hypothetical protein [Bacilli bacterium PM5-3]